MKNIALRAHFTISQKFILGKYSLFDYRIAIFELYSFDFSIFKLKVFSKQTKKQIRPFINAC